MRTPVVVLLVFALFQAGAWAQEPDPKNEARAYFRAAMAFYHARDYGHAIEEFQAAQKLMPLPDFLFNLGQAYRLEGDLQSAEVYYRRYLIEQPSGPIAEQVRHHLRHEERVSREPPAEPKIEAAPLALAAPSLRMVEPAIHHPAISRRSKRWVWIAAAAGVAVAIGVGVGVGVGIGARAPEPSASFGAFVLK